MSAPAHPNSTDLDRLHSAVKREKVDLAPESQPAPLWAMFLLMLVAIIAGGQLGVMTGGWSFNVSNPFAAGNGGDPRPGGAGAGGALDPFASAMKKVPAATLFAVVAIRAMAAVFRASSPLWSNLSLFSAARSV